MDEEVGSSSVEIHANLVEYGIVHLEVRKMSFLLKGCIRRAMHMHRCHVNLLLASCRALYVH